MGASPSELPQRLARLVELPDGFDPARDAHVDAVASPLLQRFREHDDVAAFSLLVELTQHRLLQIAVSITRRLGAAVDPEDLVANFMARLFADVRKGQPRVRRFLALGHTSMRNDARSQLRMLRRAQARNLAWSEQRRPPSDPATEAEHKERGEGLERVGARFLTVVSHCFHNLAEGDRRVLVAREVDKLTYNDIAEQLKLPRNQVGMIVKRARQRLARKIATTLAERRRVRWTDEP